MISLSHGIRGNAVYSNNRPPKKTETSVLSDKGRNDGALTTSGLLDMHGAAVSYYHHLNSATPADLCWLLAGCWHYCSPPQSTGSEPFLIGGYGCWDMIPVTAAFSTARAEFF